MVVGDADSVELNKWRAGKSNSEVFAAFGLLQERKERRSYIINDISDPDHNVCPGLQFVID